jgi:outer membrane protein TolC
MLLLPIVGAVALASSASGQTLEECEELALRNAPALQASDAETSRAEEAIREARAALAPTLKLGASYVQNSEGPKAVFRIPGSPTTQAIPLGSANVLDVRTDLALTLYSGGRDRALVHAAEAAHAGQIQTRRQAEADLRLRVAQAFHRAIAAQRMELAASDEAASAASHLHISSARVRAGVAQRVDSLRAVADLSQRSAALLRAHEAVRLARVELEAAIGAKLDSTRALVAPGPPGPDVPDVETTVGSAIQARPEMAIFDEAIHEADFRLAAAQAAHRPQVSLSGTAEYNGPNLDKDYIDFTDAGLKTYKLYAALAASIPLLDGGLKNARVGELKAQRAAIEARRSDEILEVRREVEHVVSDLRVTLAIWPSDSSRVGALREALRLAEAGYKGGTSTATDVLDAESALADARGEEAQTLMDYWIARATLDHATGAAPMKER